ncbi:MAG: SGNH/GDSL hydrolase family protein [Gammaproteobacteria bacterium]
MTDLLNSSPSRVLYNLFVDKGGQEVTYLKKILLSLGSLALLIGFSQSYATSGGRNIVVFGDSSSDAANLQVDDPYCTILELVESVKEQKKYPCGNNFWVRSRGKGLTKDGEDTPTSPPGAPITSTSGESANEFGERKMWPNYLIEKLKLSGKGNINRYSDVRERISDLTGLNVSYAFASAETIDGYLNDAGGQVPSCVAPGVDEVMVCIPGLLKQVDLYIDDISKQKKNPDTLYIFSGGGNDILNALTAGGLLQDQTQLAATLEAPEKFIEDIIRQPIKNIGKAVDMLQKSGGISRQKIYVINLPSLSQVPALQALVQGPKVSNEQKIKLLALLDDISDEYNTELEGQLKAQKLRGKNLFKVSALLTKVTRRPDDYAGISNVSDDCVSAGRAPQCDGYLWFNEKHLTSRGHEIIAEALAELVG